MLWASRNDPVLGDVVVPEGISGDYHVIVVTDALGAVDEQEAEGNNARAAAAATHVAVRPPASLRIAGATFGSAHTTGQPLGVTWERERRRGRRIGQLVERAIGSSYGDPDFDPRADLDGDSAVTEEDLKIVSNDMR